jgi:protein TonB
VNLVAAPTLSASPAPAAPLPKPKPPKPAPTVLPAQPSAPKPQPRPATKPKPEPPAQPEAPPEEEYADVMAQLRDELGEPVTEPQTEPAPAAALPGSGGGAGALVSPEVAAWLRDARVHVRRNWTLPGNFRMQSLTTAVEIELDAAGNVRGTPSIERRSGNPWYDEGVVRSIQKASPLPAPPEPGRWTFVFVSDED